MAKLVDSYSETNQNAYGNVWASYPGEGQSFTAIAGKLGSCKFYCKKNGSPTGNIWAELYAHAGTYGTSSVPTGSALATSNTIDISTLSTSYTLVKFSFTGANLYKLVNGTKYCIAVRYTGGDEYNSLYAGFDNTSPTHSGNAFYLSTVSWNSRGSGVDDCFYVYLVETVGILNWFFMKETWQKHDKLWIPKLKEGYSY